MGKRKRGRKSATLTQEEIWDDSELQEAWNEAVEEYQQYHSIQAKGEDVENVLRAVEASEEAGPQEEDEEMTHETEVEQSVEEQLDETKASKENGRSGESQFEDGPAKRVRTQEAPPAGSPATARRNGASDAGFPGMPRMVLGSEQDEALKNLMMSWYYAGYYTGLYEGQQRANRQS